MIFCKGKNNPFIKEWLQITLEHPDLVCDPNGNEINDQLPTFSGNHRHDQSIITPLAFKYQHKSTIILPELFDENRKSKIIIASRNHVNKKMYKNIFIKYHLQGILGMRLYLYIKRIFKSIKLLCGDSTTFF